MYLNAKAFEKLPNDLGLTLTWDVFKYVDGT